MTSSSVISITYIRLQYPWGGIGRYTSVIEVTDGAGAVPHPEVHERKVSYGDSATRKAASIAFALGNEL
jgi:hypothetical protein